MKELIYISNIADYENKEVSLSGWLFNRRSGKNIHFLQFRDGTGRIQCVAGRGDVSDDVFNMISGLGLETAVTIIGTVKTDARSESGYEIHVKNIIMLSDSVDYPITKKEHGTAFLMKHRHLWLRSKKQHALLRIRHEVAKAIRDYLNDNGFINIDSPIFTPSSCEGTSTLFETEYFGDKAYLSQSGQLYCEATAMAHAKVYCFGPTFRAEKSKTRRHLTEFWMVEPEMAFYDLDDDMDVMEDLVVYIVQTVLKNRAAELKVLGRDIEVLEKIQKPMPRITYDEAAQILKDAGTGFVYGDDFGAEDETIISQNYDRPVMIHRWPHKVKAFYMKRDPNDDTKVLGVDMIANDGYGEIIGGGQREESYQVLVDAIKEQNLPQEAFDWYLDLRKFGSVPHSGFGLGLERTVAWISGTRHVRETIAFPRTIDRLKP